MATSNENAIVKQVEETKESGPKVGKLKPGDYTVHILIQQVKDINMDSDRTTDVVISASCSGQTKYTETMTGVTATTEANFQEHLFLELKNQSTEQLETSKVLIKICEKGSFKDAIIGITEFDFSFVYFMNHHTMYH